MPAKISIIIPVYNNEKYLPRCIESVREQTFCDFECILIDDGSPDSCPKICDEYAAKDERIKVIHQQNCGVSAARNAGLDVARGKFVTFIDSDDWVEKEFLKELYEKITSENADVVICGVRLHFKNGTVDNTAYLPKRKRKRKLEVLKLFCKGGAQMHTVWCKLYRRELFKNHEITFPVGIKQAEDTLVNFKTCFFAQKVCFIKRLLYNYDATNENSCTLSMEKQKTHDGMIFAVQEIFKLLDEQKYDRLKTSLKLMLKCRYVRKDDMNLDLFRSTYPEVNKKIFQAYQFRFNRKLYLWLLANGHEKAALAFNTFKAFVKEKVLHLHREEKVYLRQ